MTCFYDWIEKYHKNLRNRVKNKILLNAVGIPNDEELTQKEKDIANEFKEFRRKEIENENLHITTGQDYN